MLIIVEMKVHHNLTDLPQFKNPVITIGSYDGVHMGHRQIIKKVTQLAKQNDGESIVISFHPHPRMVIYPYDKDIILLNTVEEKIALLKELDVDHLVLVPFTIEFSQQPPLEYIEQFIVKKFQPSNIVIGYDHRFGLNREGSIQLLQQYSDTYNYEVLEIAKQQIEDNAISSSRIRLAIKQGNIAQANLLLGSTYKFTGKVIHGEKIGEFLGYPTANLELNNTYKLIPSVGIYAVRIQIDDEIFDGMMYIGDKPTLEGDRAIAIEVNIFAFKDSLYGKNIEVEVIEFVREDKKFDSLDALKAGITADKVKVESILALHPNKKKVYDVAIVILNYNGVDHLETYLPPLVENTAATHEIVIIDNGSTDDSRTFIKEYYPEIRVIELEQNLGFAGGYNEGLQEVQSLYIVLLNSDVRVSSNWLEPLIDRLRASDNVGAVQPKILSDEEKEKFEYAGAAGGLMDVLNYPYCHGRTMSHTEIDEGQYDKAKEIFWASGAAFATRGELFKKIGGFDEALFAHQEEIDLCWKMKKAGYEIWMEPNSKVYHLGGGTLDYQSSRKTYLNFRNNQIIILKNEPLLHLLWKVPARMVLDFVAMVKFILQGEGSHALAILKAWGYIIIHLLPIIKRRSEDKKSIKECSIGKYNSVGKTKRLVILDMLYGKKA